MNMVRAIRTEKELAATDRSMRVLYAFLFWKMRGANDGPAEAAAQAEAAGASRAVIDELHRKTASPATASTALSVPLGTALERAILNNSPRAAFDRMRPDMLEVPLRSRVIINTNAITAAASGEGTAKPVRRLTLSNLDQELTKSVAQVALSKEILDEAPELATRLLARVLPEAVDRATDTFLLSKLNATNAGESAGEANPSWALMLVDLLELLEEIQVGDASKLYYIMPPRLAKALSAKAYENGVITAKYNGGEILGVQILPSLSQTAGTITSSTPPR